MSLTKFYVTLSLIAFAAITLRSPVVVRAQSNCPPEQRKQFVFSAVDKSGSVIDNIRAEHLGLRVGDAPARISEITFQPNQPLDLAVLIDASVSQEKSIAIAKAAARGFLASVPNAGRDRVAIVSFSYKPNYLQMLTTDLSGIAAAIDRVVVDVPPGYVGGGVVVGKVGQPTPVLLPGSTSLWDVVGVATSELFGPKTDRLPLVLLFTDGYDTSSSDKLKTIIDEAIKNDIVMYSIGVPDAMSGSVDEQALKKLSEQTGGIAEFPGKKKEKLEAALNEIARRMRGNYVVGYCGGAAKDRAKLQLEVVDPEMRKAKPVLAYKRY